MARIGMALFIRAIRAIRGLIFRMKLPISRGQRILHQSWPLPGPFGNSPSVKPRQAANLAKETRRHRMLLGSGGAIMNRLFLRLVAVVLYVAVSGAGAFAATPAATGVGQITVALGRPRKRQRLVVPSRRKPITPPTQRVLRGGERRPKQPRRGRPALSPRRRNRPPALLSPRVRGIRAPKHRAAARKRDRPRRPRTNR